MVTAQEPHFIIKLLRTFFASFIPDRPTYSQYIEIHMVSNGRYLTDAI